MKTIVLSCLLFFAPSVAFADERPIKIGFILPLSGAAAAAGASCRNGVQLALIESSGEASSRQELSESQLEISFEDDAFEAKQSVLAYQKLRMLRQADVVVSVGAGPSHAIAPLAERDSVVQLALASDPALTKQRRNVFTFWLSAEDQGKALVEESRRRGYSRIARVTALQDGPLLVRDAFDRESGGEIVVVSDHTLPGDQADFRSVISKIRTAGPIDALHLNLGVGQLGIFAKQAREQGLSAPLFNSVTFENPAEIKAAQGNLLDQWYVQVRSPSASFIDKYHSRSPDDPMILSASCYDLVGILRKVKRSKKDVASQMTEIENFAGASGPISASQGNQFHFESSVKKITRSGFETIR